MSFNKIQLAVIIAFFCLAFPGRSEAWENYTGQAIVVYVDSVNDGNLLLVKERGGAQLTVGFYGIGIPTQRQPFGKIAHDELVKLMPKGTKLIITTVNQDPEGFVNALVQLNDHSINSRLVDEGLAWVNRTTCKAFFCRRWHIQEHIAIKARKGVWSLNLPTPPWQWGEMTKGK